MKSIVGGKIVQEVLMGAQFSCKLSHGYLLSFKKKEKILRLFLIAIRFHSFIAFDFFYSISCIAKIESVICV